MNKNRRSNRTIKILLVLLFCILPLFFTLMLFCKDNYAIVQRRVGYNILYIAPTDLDISWYIIGEEHDSINKIGLDTERIEQYEDDYMFLRPTEFILEYENKCSIDSNLDLDVPYKLHIVHCQMHDEDNIEAGLEITVDFYTDSQGETHRCDCTLLSVDGCGTEGLKEICFNKYVHSKYVDSNIPFFKYFHYMPAIHEDPYIAHYKLWSDYWSYARVILIFSLVFLIIAIIDKPKGLGIIYVMGVFSILYCALCIGTLTSFLQRIWPL